MKREVTDWHFARPELAKKYLNLFNLGLTSARALFARRRMGKTEFLKKDFIPVAIEQGYVAVYVNLWDLETDPATAIIAEFYKAIEPSGFEKAWALLKHPINKVKISGKVPGMVEGMLETDLNHLTKLSGTLLMEAMRAFDKHKQLLLLVIDEAQVLAYKGNTEFAQALRSALDIRKERIKVIFAGSSEATLRRMFGVASEPFYNWAPLEPFELLDDKFVIAMVNKVNSICKYSLSVEKAMEAFIALKNTPEFFRRYIEQYIYNPELGSLSALVKTKASVFDDKNFTRQWDSLMAVDQFILTLIAKGKTDLHGKTTLQEIWNGLGIEKVVDKNTSHNALRRLLKKHMITKIEYGVYQFEDEAFAEWVRLKDKEIHE